MRAQMKGVVAVTCVVVLAGAFWFLLLAPKRDKASELSERKNAIANEVATEQSSVTAGLAAKHRFPVLYKRLVQLGKAVPAEAATPSLLVQLQGIGKRARTSFVSISIAGGAAETSTPEAEAEAEATQLPLGAAAGSAGLPAMPYTLEFEGGYFEIAKFIEELDSLVETKATGVDAKGRLVTIDSFSIAPPNSEEGKTASGSLTAKFQVTTYVAPTGQGLTAGASETGPAPESTETETP